MEIQTRSAQSRLTTLRCLQWLILGLGVVVALYSGAYLGLFSCGGYRWHWELRAWLELLILLAWVFTAVMVYRASPPDSRSLWLTAATCILFYLGIQTLFVTVMATAAPFYPAPPESFDAWYRGFLIAWRTGPC